MPDDLWRLPAGGPLLMEPLGDLLEVGHVLLYQLLPTTVQSTDVCLLCLRVEEEPLREQFLGLIDLRVGQGGMGSSQSRPQVRMQGFRGDLRQRPSFATNRSRSQAYVS